MSNDVEKLIERLESLSEYERKLWFAKRLHFKWTMSVDKKKALFASFETSRELVFAQNYILLNDEPEDIQDKSIEEFDLKQWMLKEGWECLLSYKNFLGLYTVSFAHPTLEEVVTSYDKLLASKGLEVGVIVQDFYKYMSDIDPIGYGKTEQEATWKAAAAALFIIQEKIPFIQELIEARKPKVIKEDHIYNIKEFVHQNMNVSRFEVQ